ncbi:DUF58 domain-containing protein [Hoeflea ulvae]|uniref:DUF58 domain-containing protein n=1 Tax=Hoeflea ulvae TaxID=2983764 RepID=A0ABT3YKT1_9HYPH|nr:DUF58 domain-containing protein [Hoeflea ulvae]MCY0096496.1 DUF58 domain-containing protein [Hoeflea ulvae]
MTGGDGTTVTAEMLIDQRRAVLKQMRTPPPTSALPGGFAISKRGQGQVIADSRVFVQGDEIRYVDRGATARSGILHVRTFHEERDRVTFLVADFRPSMLWGMRRAFRSVAAAEALAWLGWQSVEAGGRVGLLAITAEAPLIVGTRGGTRGMLAVIGGLVQAHDSAMRAALAAAGQSTRLDEPQLGQALDGLKRIVPRGGSVVIASALDRLGEGFDAVVGNLSRYHRPMFLLIEDRALQELPSGHYPIRGPDGRRRAARFRSAAARPDAARKVDGYDLLRIDAGMPTHDAMTQAWG